VISVHARVKDIMTANVVAVRPDASYREMARMLPRRRVSGLPVVDAEGIVCRSDVLSVFSRPDEDIRREITQDGHPRGPEPCARPGRSGSLGCGRASSQYC
jgi:CBS domain-containing protein